MRTFSVHHALRCVNGGLVIARHNDISDEVIHLSIQAFSPHFVCGEPLIHLGHRRYEEEVRHRGSFQKTRGDVSIRGLWKFQTEAIIEVSFGDYDADTSKPEEMDNILAQWWEIKKDKHRKHRHGQQKKCIMFVLSVDGIMGKESQVVLATLSRIMAA